MVEQFEPHLLNDHLAGGRPWDLDRSRGGLRVLPPYESDRNDQDGFADGNAEALWRNSAVIDEVDPEAV
ncbi:MAG: glucose-1-phosphate adenylyltransferase, partial [Acidimicrobiales bacterium]